MKKILLLVILLAWQMTLFCQMPACISMEPPYASAYDSITLTFDPALACYQWAPLSGVPLVYMHSGVTIGTTAWQHVINYNAIGVNGQLPLLTPNGNGTYSIHYKPSAFYGLPPGLDVTQLCIVFNDGQWNSKDGRDFVPGMPDCMDIFVPLQPPAPEFHLIVNMQKAYEDGLFDPLTDSMYVAIQGFDTIKLARGTGYSEYKYSSLIDTGLTQGAVYHYKFRINSDQYEIVDRTITANPGMNYSEVWWNDVPGSYIFKVIVDFEDGTTGPLTMHVMGCGPWDYLPLSETFTIVDNPDSSGINTSSKVMKFIRRGTNNGGLPWAGFWANIYPFLDISEMKYIHVKAYKPRFSPLVFKIEAGTSGTMEVPSTNSQSLMYEWEDFVFDFSSMEGTYPIVGFFPDYESPLFLPDDIVIYFDDIVLSDRPYQIFTGVKPGSAGEVKIFPNPCHDLVTISSNKELQRICIYDVMGRTIKEFRSNFEDENIRISLTDLIPGIYFISLVERNGGQSFTKIMKD